MTEYIFLEKGAFESKTKFQGRLNEMAKKGWKISSTVAYPSFIIILEKSKESSIMN